MKPLEKLIHEKFDKKKKIYRSKIELNTNDIKYKSGLYHMIEEFKKLIKLKKNDLPNFHDYLKTMKLIKVIYE